MKSEKKNSALLRRAAIILFWLCVWQIAAMLVHNSIALVGPVETLRALFVLLPTAGFWTSIGGSFAHISLGFLSAFLCGILLGALAYRFSLVREFLAPLMTLMKSIPVASFVILALLWIGSRRLSVFIAFMVVLPMIYENTLSGLNSTDIRLLEMAAVFRVPLFKKIRFIYLPALLPYLLNGCRVALGMSWKSGVAAELIGLPSGSIGERLYMSKIYLQTADLFAWTLVIIVISAVFERVVLAALGLLVKKGGDEDENLDQRAV